MHKAPYGPLAWSIAFQVARFHSLEELLAFMIRGLADVQHQADAP